MKKVVILTCSELRHQFVRKAIALAPGIDVLMSICEGRENSLDETLDSVRDESNVQCKHIAERARSEEDFFGSFVSLVPDRSRPFHAPYGSINESNTVKRIKVAAPDIIAAYGCSLVKSDLLECFSGRLINIHLGLSPYYRGDGTNFWALVNGEPEMVGATFMFMDKGVDTGEIIHQIRARVFPGDTPHQIGNRLISDVAETYVRLIQRFDELQKVTPPPVGDNGRYYRRADFTPKAVVSLRENFANGLIDRYLAEQGEREDSHPLVVNPVLSETEPK